MLLVMECGLSQTYVKLGISYSYADVDIRIGHEFCVGVYSMLGLCTVCKRLRGSCIIKTTCHSLSLLDISVCMPGSLYSAIWCDTSLLFMYLS